MTTKNVATCWLLTLSFLMGCGTTDDNQSPQQSADVSTTDLQSTDTQEPAADTQEPAADTQESAADTQEPVADTATVDTAIADSGPSLDTVSADTSSIDSDSGSSIVAKTSVPQGYFQLVDPLDEPEFYCLDIPGYKSSLKLDSPLMMHTCKQKKGGNGDDELFAWNQPKSGQIQAYKYNRCAQASSKNAGTTVILKICSESQMQQWVITTTGQIRLANSGLCMAAETAAGTVAGGNSNMRRDMRLESCDTVDPKLATWTFPGT